MHSWWCVSLKCLSLETFVYRVELLQFYIYNYCAHCSYSLDSSSAFLYIIFVCVCVWRGWCSHVYGTERSPPLATLWLMAGWHIVTCWCRAASSWPQKPCKGTATHTTSSHQPMTTQTFSRLHLLVKICEPWINKSPVNWRDAEFWVWKAQWHDEQERAALASA